jgi:pimeloyl-ACP methyl ester carboxylesterase
VAQNIHQSTIESVNTRWADEGDGTPILLVHGGGQGYCLDVWKDVSADLSKDWRVVAVDLPGYGGTELASNFHPIPIVDFLQTFIDEICDGKAHLVGHSVNGNHVVNLALRSPEVLLSATTVGTGRLLPGYENPGRPGGGGGGAQRTGEPQPPTIDEVKATLLRDVFDEATLTDERLKLVHDMIIANFDQSLAARRAGGARDQSLDDAEPLWTQLGDVKVPFMAVFGDGDKNGAGTRAADLIRERPNIRVELIPNCRHLVQWDAPLVLSQLLNNFCSE